MVITKDLSRLGRNYVQSGLYIENYFPIVRASTLSLEDHFLDYNPKSERQREFKERLIEIIEYGLSDFRAQRMDATLGENDKICYKAGKRPAIAKTVYWWEKNARDFMPEKKSRLGTTNERIAFLGLLIKYLIEEKGYLEGYAWYVVCDESTDLGHYLDSRNAKHEFEPTGSRQIGEWYDLANTYKLTSDGFDEFSLTGGHSQITGKTSPLGDAHTIYLNRYINYGVGWIVLDV